MIERKASFYLGVFVFVIPFLGFPTLWKMVLVVFGGVLLILTSLKVPNPRKIQKIKFDDIEQKPEVPVIDIVLQHNTKPIEPVIVQAPVVEAPIIKIDKDVKTEVKKTRKPRVKKLDIKQ